MSKEETIIQTWNSIEQKYEYSVKGFNVTESVEKLLLRHKEEYDKQKLNIGSIQGYLEAKKDFESQLAELKAENERLKKMNDRLSQGIYWGNGEQFSKRINDLKQQLKEKDEELNRLRKGEYQKCCKTCEAFQHQKELTEEALKSNTKQVCEKIRNKFGYKHNSQLMVSSKYLCDFLEQIEKGKEDDSKN